MDVIKPHRPAQSPEIDPSTLSNYKNFNITQTHLHLDILFDEQIVDGTVKYEMEALNTGVKCVELDTSFLNVNSVSINGTVTDFTLHDRFEPLGSKLSIPLPALKTPNFELSVAFSTTDKCTALQFLAKEATDGKTAPYLFCQCQPIHARSLFPCFDTPSIKSAYKLSATSPSFILMSGRPVKQEGNTYYFDQPIPIPSYLISVASGDITKAKIGPRSDVYCEPINIKDCQWEFEKDMEDFIKIAEELIFDYEWLRFDSLILPFSFPYGGMEIPNLCQLTNTLICKDRSQVTVLAHELAHSWSGNLVTNCSWEHFWLNEGWTVYIERRIIEGIATNEARAAGKPDPFAYGESMRHFSAILGWCDLESRINSMGGSADKFSTLVQELKSSQDPDDAFSTVPYEKGFNLLFLIEKTVGGKKVFDKFIPHYFKMFRYKSLDTYQFMDALYAFFSDKTKELDSIDWDAWLYKPGMPPVDPKFDTTLADECYQLADKWHSSILKGEDLSSKFSQKDISEFAPNQSVLFLDTLISLDKRDNFSWKSNQQALKLMEKIYPEYCKSQNAEILFRWYVLQVSGEIVEYIDRLGQWLGTVGRMKYVRPGYTLLNSVNREKAIYYFTKFKDGYHPICKSMVMKDLGLN